MKDKKITCHSVWQEYQKDLAYKNNLDLFGKTEKHHNFFLGRQWEGLDAPDLEKPILNFVKRVVNYLVSVLMVNDVALSLSGGGDEELTMAVQDELAQINENSRFSSKLRKIIKNAAVEGDGAIYVYYDRESHSVDSSIISNVNVVFGDKTTAEVEKQPYIILVKQIDREIFEKMYPEAEENYSAGFFGDNVTDTVTVLIRLYKKNGTVHFTESCEHCMLHDETDSGQKLYPLSFMNWENVRDSYHGMGAVETIVPNQIAVNKLWAMALLYQKNNAFPKIFIDKTKLDKWNSSPGAVMGVVGNPNDAVATSFRPQDMASQLMAIVDKTISYTKDFMGANDAALGNVAPNNTSAIVTLQKSSVAPLELQRQALYQFVEDYARILYDIVKTHYGMRKLVNEKGELYIDFGKIPETAKLTVNIGQSEYWSESAQVQTLDGLFTKGIIDDAIIYLENLPDRVLPGKNRIIEEIKENRRKQERMDLYGLQTENGDGLTDYIEEEESENENL